MSSAPARPGDQQVLLDAFRRLSAVLRENGAVDVLENLAPGAKPLALSRLEQKLGFSLPKGLRALWLMHDGEKKPVEGFVAPLRLLPVAWVLNERVRALGLVERLRAEPGSWAAAGVTPAEATSSHWLPIAAGGGGAALVAGTGRVFESAPEPPVLRLVAPSVPAWLAGYAARAEAPEG